MPLRANRLLLAIWLCFALRLVFYAAVYPLWEGLDEWGHMAYLDHLRQTGEPPHVATPVSGEIAASLRLLPLPHHVPPFVGAGTSHEAYWKLPPAERERRQWELQRLRIDDTPLPQVRAENYQAQHPPAAYRLLHLLDAAFGFDALPARVFALRFSLVAIISLCLPLLWLLCRIVFAIPGLAAPTCLMLAVMPGFAVYFSRVSNDALAAVLLALGLVVFAGVPQMRNAYVHTATAAFLAAITALTKAFGILLIPVYAASTLRPAPEFPSWSSRARHIAVFLAIFLAVAGWWYTATFIATGTLSGESLDVSAAAIPLTERLPNLLRVDWWSAWLYGSSSHIWVGGWSFLQIKEWMYWVFRVVALVAAFGLLLAGIQRLRRRPEDPPFTRPAFWLLPLPLFALFIVSLAYQGWQIFNTQGDSTVVGWYLSLVTNAEIVVLVAGLGYVFGVRVVPKLAAALALILALLDLFTLNLVSLPFYAGLTSLSAVFRQGAMPVLSASDWPAGGFLEVANRLSANHPSWLPPEFLLILWVLYLCATAALMLLALREIRKPSEAETGGPIRKAREPGKKAPRRLRVSGKRA